MAGFNVAGLSVYTKQVGELFAKSIIPNTLYDSVEIMENVKYRTAINLFDQTLYLQADACGLTVSGDTPLTQRVLEVCELTSFDRFCMSDLKKYWTNELLAPGANITDMDFFGEYYLPRLSQKIEAEVQKIAWLGDSDDGVGNLGLCDGWIYLLSGASGAVQSGTTTGVTVSTIVPNINLMITAIPAAIAGKELNIYLSNSLYNIWVQAWATTYSGAPFYLNNDDKKHPFYNNITFKPQGGLEGTNYILIGEKENFVYGTDILNDTSQISVHHDPTDDYVYVQVKWHEGVQVKWPDQIVKNYGDKA